MLKNYGREILASAKASGFAFDRDRDRSGNAKRMRKLTSTACALNLQTFSRINLIQQRRGYRPRRSFLAKQNATSDEQEEVSRELSRAARALSVPRRPAPPGTPTPNRAGPSPPPALGPPPPGPRPWPPRNPRFSPPRVAGSRRHRSDDDAATDAAADGPDRPNLPRFARVECQWD